MPELPKLIEVKRSGRAMTVVIDGQALPFPISREAKVDVSVDKFPTVTIQLLAERVTVIDDIATEEEI